MGPVWVDVDTLGGLVMTDAGLQIALYELTSHELNVVGASAARTSALGRCHGG